MGAPFVSDYWWRSLSCCSTLVLKSAFVVLANCAGMWGRLGVFGAVSHRCYIAFARARIYACLPLKASLLVALPL